MNPPFEVIPAIDIQNGKTVQLVGGLRGTEKYYGDPIECALQWEELGAKVIHIVDIDGAFEGEIKNKSINHMILIDKNNNCTGVVHVLDIIKNFD